MSDFFYCQKSGVVQIYICGGCECQNNYKITYSDGVMTREKIGEYPQQRLEEKESALRGAQRIIEEQDQRIEALEGKLARCKEVMGCNDPMNHDLIFIFPSADTTKPNEEL